MSLPKYDTRRVFNLVTAVQHVVEEWEQVDPAAEDGYRIGLALGELKLALRNLDDPPYPPMEGKWR